MAGLTPKDGILGKKAEPTRKSSSKGDVGSSPLCPQCGSSKVWRDAQRYTIYGDKIQRWLCRECGFRFSDPNDLKNSWSTQEKAARATADNEIKASDALLGTRQVCVTETKNLSAEQQTSEVLRRNEAEAKGKIIEHAFWMQKEGYAESTITRRIRLLRTIANKGANLQDPESVKETLSKQQKWQTKTKEIAVETYSLFLKMQGLTWNPPKYKGVKKLPFIPTEDELNSLIAGCNRKTSVFLQLLKETGMRCGEAFMLKWTDFNFENRTADVTPEKGSEPRQLKLSTQLIAMLNSLPKDVEQPFGCSHRHFTRTFRQQRTKVAIKLKNDRIRKIHFNTLRHWKATME